MLTLIKLIRNLFKQLKSDLTPAQIAVGVFFGAVAGLTPFGLHLLLLFTLALLVNCSMAACLLVFGTLKPVGLALGGASFGTGVSLLQSDGATAALIRGLSSAPVLAWLGFDRYVVAGGYAIAVPIAVVFAAVFGLAVASYRKKLAPKLADAAWFEKAMKNGLFRFFKWLIAGKDKELVEPKKRLIVLRPFRAYMVAFIPLLYVGLTVGGGLYAQVAINGIAAQGVSRALGVQCTFGKIDYSFFGQRLAFENFQLPDPSNTKEDMVRVGGFEADLGFVSLLSKQIHIEKLAVKDIAANVARKEDGKLNVTDVPGAQPQGEAGKSKWTEYTDWLSRKGKDADWAEMWNKYQEYRKNADEERKAEEAAKARGEKPKTVLAYDADLRWVSPKGTPRVRVDLIELKNVSLKVTDRSGKGAVPPGITSLEAQGTAISEKPGWNGAPLTVKGSGLLADGKSGKISFTLSYLPGKSDVDFSVDGVPVVDWRAVYEKTVPVNVDGGKATLSTKAGVRTGNIDGQAVLRIDQLKVSAKPGQKPILGLNAETSGYAIQGINAYGEKLPIEVTAGVTGPLDSPSINAKLSFLEIAKKGLEMMGRKELQKYIDALGGEVDALKKGVGDKLAPIQSDATKAVDALKSGDVKGVQDAATKLQTDTKALQDKDELKKKADELKKLEDLNPFKKKEEPKKDEKKKKEEKKQ
jgi:uncharacterized protein (TIGR03546 family)